MQLLLNLIKTLQHIINSRGFRCLAPGHMFTTLLILSLFPWTSLSASVAHVHGAGWREVDEAT